MNFDEFIPHFLISRFPFYHSSDRNLINGSLVIVNDTGTVYVYLFPDNNCLTKKLLSWLRYMYRQKKEVHLPGCGYCFP